MYIEHNLFFQMIAKPLQDPPPPPPQPPHKLLADKPASEAPPT